VRLYRDHRLRVSLQRLLGLQGQALHPVPYIRSIFIEEPLSRSKGTGRAASATRPTTAPVTTVAESANRCSSTIRSPTMTSHQFHVAQTVYIRPSGRRSRLIRDQSGAAGRKRSPSVPDQKLDRAV
jgi:hypothetical protein